MTDDELELRDYLQILRRRWIWVLLPLLVVPALAAGNSLRSVDQYRSTATVILQSTAAEGAVGADIISTSKLRRELENEINVATGDEVDLVVEGTLGSLPSVDVSASEDADLLEFTATSTDPEEAALAANTWADAYVSVSQSRAQSSVTAAVAQLQDRLAELRVERQQLRSDVDALEDQEVALSSEIGAEQLLLDQQRQADALAQENTFGTPTSVNPEIIATENRIASLQAQLNEVSLARQRLASELAPELNVLDSQVSTIAASIAELQLSGELASAGTARLNSAAAPAATPINSPLSRDLILGIVVGGILGAGLALLVENLDRRVKIAEDLERVTQLPNLGVIPEMPKGNGEPGLMTLSHPTSPVADGYHKVRTALQFSAMSRQLEILLVTSANQSEGKTSTAANLAWALAATGKRVLLIDADLRRPRVHKVYGAVLTPGMTDVLLSDLKLSDAVASVQHDGVELAVLAAGTMPPNPGDLLASPTFTAFLRDVRDEADMVIIDAPPVLPVADALTIAPYVDGVVLAAFAGTTEKEQIAAAGRLVDQAGGTALGTILVGGKESDAYSKSDYYGARSESASLAVAPEPGTATKRRGALAARNGSSRGAAATKVS